MHYRLFGKAFRVRDKIFKQNLPENYSKSTKIAITARKFSNFLVEHTSRTPLELFLFLNQLQICSAEKNTLEKMWKLCPLPLQNFSLRHWIQVCRYQQISIKEMLQQIMAESFQQNHRISSKC